MPKVTDTVVVAVVAALTTLPVEGAVAVYSGNADREAAARGQAVSIALEGAETPNDIGRRLRVVYQIYPDLRDELGVFLPHESGSSTSTEPDPREYGSVFGTDGEARMTVLVAIADKAVCAAEVAAAWEALFGPKAQPGGTEGMQWATDLAAKVRGHCDAAPS